MNRMFMLLILLLVSLQITAQQEEFPKLTGPYLGQKPPGKIPKLFAPGILPSSIFHTTPVFTADGKEVYWKILGTKTISMMKQKNNVWTIPEEITLSLELNDFRDPVFSPDGKKMFFLSKSRLSYQKEEKENIWFVERTGEGWSDPKPLSERINSHTVHWQVSVASNGSLYFMSRNKDGLEDLYLSKCINNVYQNPERLSSAINSEKFCETTPFISPSEDYLIFARWDLSDEKGLMQLYISFCMEDGTWSQAQKIKNIDYGVCPQVTADNKYFFFIGMHNGEVKPMWMDANFIEELKLKNLE